MTNTAYAVVDGRTARRDRNRELVLNAVLAVFADGHLTPSAHQVAERSGVSLRSVFRYYEDTDGLVRAAIARHLELIAPLFEIPALGEGPCDDRVRRYVAARLRLYRAVAPSARASLLLVPKSPIVAERFAQARRDGREQLEAMFAPELGVLPPAQRRSTLAAADTMCQFEGLEHLCEHLGLSDAQAGDVLRRSLRALLTSA